MSVHQLGYVRVEADPKAFSEWEEYLNDLLLHANVRVEDGEIRVQLDSRSSRITIGEGPSNDVTHVGWDVATHREWKEFLDKAEAEGLNPKVADQGLLQERQVLELFQVTDPSGLINEVFYGPIVDDARNLDRRLAGAFLAGDLGAGHAALFVDPDTYRDTIAFFRDFLGLTESGRRESDISQGVPISMFLCNPRQHSLAIVPLKKPGGKRLAHFSLEFTELDLLGKSHDRAVARDIIKATLGRHQADNTVSYYAITPSGFEMEVGWDSRMVPEGSGLEQFRAQKLPSIWGHRREDR